MHSITPEAAELASELRRLRAACGNPTLSAISNATNGYASIATLSRLFSGKALPSLAAVLFTARVLSGEDGVEVVRVLYSRAKKAQQRARPLSAERRPRPLAGQVPVAGTEGVVFQDRLRALVAKAGLSVRELAYLSGVPRSTLGDALSHPRPPQPRVVAAIARACGVPAGPWVRAARAARENVDEPLSVVSIREIPRSGLAAPASGNRNEQSGAQLAGFSPSDVLIEAALTRPPGEIADLVTRLRASGDTALAERLLKVAAQRRTVEDVAALALALRKGEQAAAGSRTLPPPRPSPELPFPAEAVPPVIRPAEPKEHWERPIRSRRAAGFP
ncbi:helix-turn-helix domain-containing protein [Streptomyces sp. NPDC088762]|uniref:helix-turn-helix domain-containing protein n=1 Tax=Streptomyces sp. NPDC088762 TaxID=3365891 RepID=UPI0037FBE99E